MLEEIKGTLHETPFSLLLARLYREGATGVLEIVDAVGMNKAFFANGVPQGAKLSRLKNPLGRILVDAGKVTESQLSEALGIHNKTTKLLGQVLLELGAIDESILNKAMSTQSRRNFMALFDLRVGEYEYLDGLVHLQDFVHAPVSPLWALYRGILDHKPPKVLAEFYQDVAFQSLMTTEAIPQDWLDHFGDAERCALSLMQHPIPNADLARRIPLPLEEVGALTFALNELGMLRMMHPLRSISASL